MALLLKVNSLLNLIHHLTVQQEDERLLLKMMLKCPEIIQKTEQILVLGKIIIYDVRQMLDKVLTLK